MSEMIQITACVDDQGKLISFVGESLTTGGTRFLTERLEFVKDVFRQVVEQVERDAR